MYVFFYLYLIFITQIYIYPVFLILLARYKSIPKSIYAKSLNLHDMQTRCSKKQKKRTNLRAYKSIVVADFRDYTFRSNLKLRAMFV